jgi:hypothetical protein
MDSKTAEDFRNWLISSQNLQRRSAGDIISRRNKLLSIISDPINLTINQIKIKLEDELVRGSFKRATLNAMVRSEKLFREFKNL